MNRVFGRRERLYPIYTQLTGNSPGDGHPRHADNCRFDPEAGKWVPNHAPHYTVTASLYLNRWGEDFSGGELVLPESRIAILPEPGLLVVFWSDHRFEHEVPRVNSGKRHGVLLWFTRNADRAEAPLASGRIEPRAEAANNASALENASMAALGASDVKLANQI